MRISTFLTTAFASLILCGLMPLTAQTTCKGKTFAVTSYGTAAAAKAALAIAEATNAPAQKIFGRPRKKHRSPLKLHLFPSAVGFAEAITRLPDGVDGSKLVSFASPKSATAYVTMHPEASAKALDELILTGPSARRIAHEAVRVYCYGHLENHSALPVWLIEGAASLIAQDVLVSQGFAAKKISDDPFTSTQLRTVIKLSNAGKLPAVGSVLGGRVSKLSPTEQDAIHAVMFRFLLEGKHKGRFKRVLKKASTMKPSPDFTTKLARYAGTALKMGRTNDDFQKWLKEAKPLWDEVVPALSKSGDGWASAAHANLNAVAWQVKPVGRKSWTMGGKFTIFDGSATQLNILVGRSPAGFVSIALEAGYGATVFQFDRARAKWKEVDSRQFSGIKKGAAHEFTLTISGSDLSLSIDGEQVVSSSITGVDFSGPWGLGAQAGSTGVWQDLTVK